MDIVAHGWWVSVGMGTAALAGHAPPHRRTAVLRLAVASDLVHLLPVAVGELQATGSLGTVRDHPLAVACTEPPMPATVEWLAPRLPCLSHSAPEPGA